MMNKSDTEILRISKIYHYYLLLRRDADDPLVCLAHMGKLIKANRRAGGRETINAHLADLAVYVYDHPRRTEYEQLRLRLRLRCAYPDAFRGPSARIH